MAEVTIETIKNGPYIVTGPVELKDADGNAFPVEKRMALCRCGASTEKPFLRRAPTRKMVSAQRPVPNPQKAKPGNQPLAGLSIVRTARIVARFFIFNENSLFARYRRRSLGCGFAESVGRRTVAADDEETGYG